MHHNRDDYQDRDFARFQSDERSRFQKISLKAECEPPKEPPPAAEEEKEADQ